MCITGKNTENVTTCYYCDLKINKKKTTNPEIHIRDVDPLSEPNS